MKKVICILLSICILFTFFACADDEKDNGEINNGEQEKEIQVIEGKYIVKDRLCDYSVLLPTDADGIINYASSELQILFSEATGIDLSVVTDNASIDLSKKYFSIGETSLAKSANINFDSDNNSEAFKIKTYNDSIVILGNGEYANLWGVYELLSILFNYEFYSADTYFIDKNVAELPLYNLDFFDEPDIEYRATGDGQSYTDLSVSRRFRWLKSDREFFLNPGNWCHNSFYYFGATGESGWTPIAENYPEYAVKNGDDVVGHKFVSSHFLQLCYTAHGDEQALNKMLEVATEKIVEIAKANETLDYIMFGMMDSDNKWCTCDACTSAKEKYGAESGAVVAFLNRLHAKVSERKEEIGREINIVFFAYNKLESAPIKNGEPTIKCDDGVSVLYAPIYADWTIPFDSQDNYDYYTILKDWEKVSKSVLLWTYHTNYTYFIYPYDCFNTIQTNYKLFGDDENVIFIFNQGKHKVERASAFFTLAEYLNSKLSWNSSLDINKLTDSFFENYFGLASETMKKYYTEFRMHLVEKEVSGGVYDSLIKTEYWPKATINGWLNLIEQAYNDIESLKTKNPTLYQKLYDHINLESITLRLIYVECIDKTSSTRDEMINALIKDCEELQVSYYSESETMQEHLSKLVK